MATCFIVKSPAKKDPKISRAQAHLGMGLETPHSLQIGYHSRRRLIKGQKDSLRIPLWETVHPNSAFLEVRIVRTYTFVSSCLGSYPMGFSIEDSCDGPTKNAGRILIWFSILFLNGCLVIWLEKVHSIIPIKLCMGMSISNYLNDIHGLSYGYCLHKCMSLYINSKLHVEWVIVFLTYYLRF